MNLISNAIKITWRDFVPVDELSIKRYSKNPVKSRKLRQKITGSFGLLPLRMTGVSGVRMMVRKKRSLGRNRFW